MMNEGFNVIILMTMFLCFFALSANMSANLYQQTKEIAVLRSIGFTKARIKLLYFYEAMVLVLASSTMGVMVGMVVGYTMSLQESLILSTDLSVYFPW
jgi:ABC-type antimicrobial peptide transport system permease subunit